MFLLMDYDDSKELFFLSEPAKKMQVDISVLSSLPQISLTGCYQATRKKHDACEVWESSLIWQAKGPAQVIFSDSNKICLRHKDGSIQHGGIYLCSVLNVA